MGCSSPQNASIPNIPPYHLNRLMQVSNINHALNVNRKYEHLSRIDHSQQIGEGLKKTYAYEALTTKQEISQKRKQYWETRVNGQPHIWKVIQQVVCTDDQDAGRLLLEKNKISMLNDSIQMCVDSKLNKYEVPVFCINEPTSYSFNKIEDKNLNFEYEDTTMEICIRSAKYTNGDIKMSQKASCEISVIKDSVRAMKQLTDGCKIRFFYTGRQMKDDKTLGNYNYVPGTVIQAMIL